MVNEVQSLLAHGQRAYVLFNQRFKRRQIHITGNHHFGLCHIAVDSAVEVFQLLETHTSQFVAADKLGARIVVSHIDESLLQSVVGLRFNIGNQSIQLSQGRSQFFFVEARFADAEVNQLQHGFDFLGVARGVHTMINTTDAGSYAHDFSAEHLLQIAL